MTGKEKFDFGSEVAKILPSILRSVTQSHETIFSRGTLSVPHIVVLELLREKGPCKMSELAKVLYLTMSAVTAIVDRMIELNLVKRERSLKDRRVVRVKLLKKGEFYRSGAHFSRKRRKW